MKRILILLTLIAFATASCTGPGKVGRTKPNFRQDPFEKDRADCIEAAKTDPEQKITVEECLARKGYESQPEPASEKEKSKATEIAKTIAAALIITVGMAVIFAAAFAAAVLQSYGGR